MTEKQQVEFLKAQREVMVAQVVLQQRNVEGLQAQNSVQTALQAFRETKARLEQELNGTINEETLEVTANPPS